MVQELHVPDDDFDVELHGQYYQTCQRHVGRQHRHRGVVQERGHILRVLVSDVAVDAEPHDAEGQQHIEHPEDLRELCLLLLLSGWGHLICQQGRSVSHFDLINNQL